MAEPTRRALVVGSVHMDLIARAHRLPGPGESVTGGAFAMAPGGKAGNQACALARLGVESAILARVGDDGFGRQLVRALADGGIDTRFVAVDPETATGASTIFAVDGDYSSIIAPGAAARLALADLERVERAGWFEVPGMLVVQLELPIAVTLDAARTATRRDWIVVLNASPAPDDPRSLPSELWELADLLVVNRIEATRLLGRRDGADPRSLAVALRDRVGVPAVVVTAGAAGAAGADDRGSITVDALPATVVDAVGAGDAFLAALAVGYPAGLPLAEALRRGVAAGAIAVERPGAHDALPTADEIDRRLQEVATP